MSTKKSYIIMKDGTKIKTAKSLISAKAIAEAEQAEVFCNGEHIYQFTTKPDTTATTLEPMGQESVSVSNDEEMPEQVNQTEAMPNKETVAEEKPTAYRLKALMNVRKSPSLQAEILDTAKRNTIVNVHEIKNDWMKVSWNNWIAYIFYDNRKFAESAKQ